MNNSDTTVVRTLMYQEAIETPARFRDQLEALQTTLAQLGKRLREHPPRLAITCGRGSSDHAGVFARYLIETALHIPTASATPSTLSVYGANTRLDDTLVILVSQSGQSPDLVAYAAAAKQAGALTVGLINRHVDAPLAAHCDFVLPLCAGAENAVAATKSYLCTLFASLQLVAHWTADSSLQADLRTLPAAMEQAQALDWSAAVDKLTPARNMLVLGRGPGLGIANEMALKFKETCALHAESFSAAEVLHGPLAMIRAGFPVLVFNQGDNSSASIQQTLIRLQAAGADILLAAPQPVEGCTHLPVLDGLRPWCRLLTQVQTGYLMVEQLARQRGYSPDAPAHIAKVTKTL